MTQYIDYPPGADDDGTARKFGIAMFVVAVIVGGGLLVASLTLDHKSPDPLYDANRADRDPLTSARVQVNPDLWKGKHETPVPDEPQRWTPPPAPAPESAKPTTRP